MDESVISLQEPEPKRKSPWQWLKAITLFPFRIIGLGAFVAATIGMWQLWKIPGLAKEHQVDTPVLVFRLLEEEATTRPLRRLDYEMAIFNGMINLPVAKILKPKDSLQSDRLSKVISVKSEARSGGGFEHTILLANNSSFKAVTTTAILTVPKEEIAEARRVVSQCYPPGDAAQWSGMLAWGETLLLTSWATQYHQDAPRENFPPSTEDEKIWCVFQVLKSGGTPVNELPQLPELFRTAFPKKEDQDAALAWAETTYDRLDAHFRTFLEANKKEFTRKSERGQKLAPYFALKTVMPPKGRWTYCWLLQEHVGLSPAGRAAARQKWLDRFPSSRHEEVLAFGEELLEERRQQKERLPNVPDMLPLLCVVERITGSDHQGAACVQAAKQIDYGGGAVKVALQLAYPNDDLYYVIASDDNFDVHPFAKPGLEVDTMVVAMLIIGGVTRLGVHTFIAWFMASWMLKPRSRELWEEHQEGRGHVPAWLWFISAFLIAGVGTLAAPYSITKLIGIQLASPQMIFVGAFMATTAGGILIETVRRFIGFFAVMLGINIESTWIDEVLGILAGGFILHYFGNDFLAIGLFALADLLPSLMRVTWVRRKKRLQLAISVGAV